MHRFLAFFSISFCSAQRTRIYVNEGDQNVEIPCQIPKNVLYNPDTKIKWVFTQMDYQNGSWINEIQTIEDKPQSLNEFFEIGAQKQLILKGIATSENIGLYRCQAWGDRVSFSSQVYLILYSPPEEDQRFPEIFAKSQNMHFAKGRSSSLAMCISGYARPVPKIYWEVLDEDGKLVSTLRPTTGPYSPNPPQIKSSDHNFYHAIALELMPEHGLTVNFDKHRFRCVVEYFSGLGEEVEVLRYTKSYPTNGGIRIYHAVTQVQAFYNGEDMSGKTITLVADQTARIYCRGNGFPAADFEKEKFIVNRNSGETVVSCNGRNAINEEIDEYPLPAVVRLDFVKLEPVVVVDRSSDSFPTVFKCKFKQFAIKDAVVNIAWFSADSLISVRSEFRFDSKIMSDYKSLQCSVTVTIMNEDFTEISPHFSLAPYQQKKPRIEVVVDEADYEMKEDLAPDQQVSAANTGSLIAVCAVSAALFGSLTAVVTQYVLKSRADLGSSSDTAELQPNVPTTQDPQLNLRDHTIQQTSRSEKESYRAAIYNI